MWEGIANLFRAIAAGFEWRRQREEQQNTPDQRSNAEAEQIQADRDRARREIAARDSSALERDVAP